MEAETLTLDAANKNLTNMFCQALREGGGCLPECHDGLNDASRDVIAAYHAQYGTCFLGNINLYGDDRVALWEYDGGMVYNFGAAFVIPADDKVLRNMILDRHAARYTGIKDDLQRIEQIIKRIEELGGNTLAWA